MKGIRYAAEFKAEAIKQITERHYSIIEVSKRIGIADKTLSRWVKESQKQQNPQVAEDAASLKTELLRTKSELKRVTEERDILKKATEYSRGQCNTYT